MNNPIQLLFDEHDLIISAAETARQTEDFIGVDNERYVKIVGDLILFFRNYADKYHHYKEEEILFPEMCKQNELLKEGIVQEMLGNHDDFREMLANIEKSLTAKEYQTANKILQQYVEMLLDHIAVENDELFQIAESLFDENELERIYFLFKDADNNLGEDKKQELTTQIMAVQKSIC